nr:ribonuclease H-like domain-containing protein [Tanacetum cinerariifolium]
MLHMDLFGPTFVSSLMHKKYGLVVTDDYSRYTWLFFLASKDETTCILKKFITEIENLVDKKVKVIRCDNGTEFKNSVMNDFCAMKGIGREFSVARTPQQNGVTERRNKTLIEVARTMLANSKLPTTFWVEAVNTACYVQNRALVVKPHNKTPYELFRGRTHALSFMRPFECHVTILNTLDHLGKFDGKAYEGYFIGYSMNSKAFRVYNLRTRKVEENFHIRFLEDKPSIGGNGPKWLFDIDVLTKSMNYVSVVANYIYMPLRKDGSPLFDSSPNHSNDAGSPSSGDAGKKHDEVLDKESGALNELISTFENLNTEYPDDSKIPSLVTISTHDDSKEDDDFTNFKSSIHVTKALSDPAWVEAILEELLQFKLQKVWILVDLPKGKKAIGLQVKHKEDGIFISQDKYVAKDADGDDVDVHLYRSMIGSLMYLIASRPDIMYAKPTESEGFEQIIDFLNANPIKYALTVNPLIYTSCIKQFWATTKVKTVNGEEQIQALVDKKKVIITKTSVRSDLYLAMLKVKTVNGEEQIQALVDKKKVIITKTSVRSDLYLAMLKKASKKTHKLKRLYKKGSSTRVESSEDEGLGDQDDASKQERMIADLDADEGVALVDETQGRNDQDMFDTSILDDEELVAKKEVSTADPVPIVGEVVTTTGVETSKPKAKRIVMQEPRETPTPSPIDSSRQPLKAKDKGKAKMIKPEKPLKRKDQIMIDEEVAMQAKLEEEERLARQKEEEDIQDSPGDKEDTRSSHEYLNDLEEEYQARALLAKSKISFKKCTQKHKPELRPTKDFEAKYNKIKAKLTLLSSGSSAPNSTSGKNKVLIAETYEWDEDEVSSDENEEIEVKISWHLLMKKEFWLARKVSAMVNGSRSLYKSTPLPSLEKLANAKPISRTKTIKSILMSNSTFKAKTLKGITLKEHSSAPAKDNKKGWRFEKKTLEEGTCSSHEYLNDLEEEYQARALLAKSKISFKKCTQKHKPELRPTKDFEAKYNKIKAELTLLSSCSSAPNSSSGKNKVLIAETYEWDEYEVSSDENEEIKVKLSWHLLMKKDFWLARKVSAMVNGSRSLYKSTPLPSLEKLANAKPISRTKTIKSILMSNSTFKAKTFKGITLKEHSSAPAKDNKKDERTAEDDIKFFSTEPGLDRISAHNFLT